MKTIKLAGIVWEVLNEETGLIVTKDIVCKKAFDESNCNKWSTSTIRKWLNGEFLATFTEAEKDAIQGEIRLLEESEINELQGDERIKAFEWEGWMYWLKSPYAANSYYVRCVNPDGSVYDNGACDGRLGVAPALNLKSGILESLLKRPETELQKLRKEFEKLEAKLDALESEVSE